MNGWIREFQLDVLREVGNIGAGHAATALSRLLEKKIGLAMPTVNILPFEQVAEKVGGVETIVTAVMFRVEGQASGHVYFVLDEASARKLLRRFAGIVQPAEGSFSELEWSALAEIGNIIAGSYISSLADFTGLTMKPTVPAALMDMAGAILANGILPFGWSGDQAIWMDAKFFEGSAETHGSLLFIPDPEAFQIIFRALGVPCV
jgi:chemotaxis protein CheC